MGADEYVNCLATIDIGLVATLGSGYIVDHCISAYKRKFEETSYKIYMSDLFKALVEHIAGEAVQINSRYFEIINPPEEIPEETSEEIINRIKRKLGG